MREVLGIEREWKAMAWDVAGQGIVYMCIEALVYFTLVSLVSKKSKNSNKNILKIVQKYSKNSTKIY